MQYRRYFFWAILIFAAVVRFKGLSTGLPLHTLYGENDTFQTLRQMLHSGDLNPGQFLYPGLAYYLHLPFLYAFYLMGHAMGYFNGIQSVPDASLIFVGRFVSAAMGTAGVYLAYRMGRYFSEPIALLSMVILAAIPQHIEFSHMLRPEVPAVFFAELALVFALSLPGQSQRRALRLLGLAAGACFSTKYNIGLPLIVFPGVAWILLRGQIRWTWIAEFVALFALTFTVTNPYLVTNPPAILYWVRRVDSFYVPAEDYYGKNIVIYYLEYLTKYNYNLPLILAAILGVVLTVFRDFRRGLLLAAYPLVVFLWICTFETRRIHGLLPLHPFLAVWAASTLDALWQGTRRISAAPVFRFAYALLLVAVLFFPFYRSGIQTYLLSRMDNRSKAELWITNRLPQGSRIALLQYHQVELDPNYFKIENFSPRSFVGQKNFDWFVQEGFDYVVISSGQYMRYFVEGQQAQRYRDYFLKFFQDAESQGTLALDLITHPTLIPDYRIKVYSTRQATLPPRFIAAVEGVPSETSYHLPKPDTSLNLQPGYYSLEIPATTAYSIGVKNLKMNEWILQKRNTQALTAAESAERFPFAIFPARLNSRISLFSRSSPEVTPNQIVEFRWTGIAEGIDLKQIRPAIDVHQVEFLSNQKQDDTRPYILFAKNEPFTIRCTLINQAPMSIAGYVESFLSQVGEPRPWKEFETASQTQDFFLDPGQEIKIEVPFTTSDLTGDHQLSFWIFTRHDLPFSPQIGGWFSKQIRVDDPKLGIHPIFGVPIP